MLRVSKIFGQEGSDAWFAHEAEYFLPEDYKCPHCGAQKGFEKESDIMDVWFDSGSSHAAVLKQRPYFEVAGRLKHAQIRGCSDTFRE